MATTPIYVNSGIGAQVIYAPETDYGVAADLSAALPLEFNSETLELKKTVVQGAGLHAGNPYNRASRRVLTNYAVSGGLNLDLPTRYLNNLLFAMFGSKNVASATLAPDGSTGAQIAVHYPGSLKDYSLTIQKGVPSVDGMAPNPFTYVGCKLTDWTISVATGQIATLALTFDGRNELSGVPGQAPITPNDGPVGGSALNATVPALGNFNEDPTNNVFHFREAALLTGTPTTDSTTKITSLTNPEVLGNVKSAEMKQAFAMDTSRYFLGSNGYKDEPIENGWRAISGQFVIEWLDSEAMYTAFANDTPISLQLQFDSSDTSSLSILVPTVYLDGDSPKASGPAVITQTVPFTGLDDQENNQIQATYITVDTV